MKQSPVFTHLLPRCAAAVLLLAWVGSALSQDAVPAPAKAVRQAAPERSVSDWLMRMHDASRNRAYVGTFVVSSAGGGLSSARILHVCDGENQLEQVEALTGVPRSTYRKNDQVMTYLHDSKVARSEKRESLSLFPGLLRAPDSTIGNFYAVRLMAPQRVAGFEADVVQLEPKDKLRFGYRIWSEKKTGLVVKLQTLGLDGQVLEQVAFSELQFDASVKMDKLARMMDKTEGYRLEKSELQKTTPAAQGWVLGKPVAGFASMSCLQRVTKSGASTESEKTMQWVFSDGLASVSLFVESFDAQRHQREGWQSLAATHSLSRRIGDWWLTAVGEVPQQTLQAFAQSLERAR